MKSTPPIMNWISRASANSAASPDRSGGIECQEHAGVAQRFGACRLIELGETYNIACAGENVGNDRLTLLAQFEGDDERWSAQLHAPPRLARLRSQSRAESPSTGARKTQGIHSPCRRRSCALSAASEYR